MNNLYFEDRYGDLHLVQSDVKIDEVYKVISNYVKQLNPDFKIYYIRSWTGEDKSVTYDVGSHSEFFILKIEE